MNTEEQQQELAQNDLGKLIERMRSRYAILVEEHGNRILLWGAALVLLLLAWIFYSRTTTVTNADGWSALSGASNTEELSGIADAYQGSPIGDWARLSVGERYLQTGVTQLFTDREASVAELEGAKTAFEALVNKTNLAPAIRERALFGMARTLEATSTGDLQPSIAAYEKLLQEFPETPYKNLAEKQVKVLKNKNSQEFYAWFATQKPTPQDRDMPSDLLKSLNLPGMEGITTTPAATGMTEEGAASENGTEAQPNPILTVPATPEFPPAAGGKPEMKTEDAKPAAETPAAAPAEGDKPKAEAEKAKEEKPATPPAADAAPAAETKPAAEAPAAEKPADAPATEAKPAAEQAAPEQPKSNDGN